MLVYPVRLIVWMIDDLVDHEDLLQLPGLLQDLLSNLVVDVRSIIIIRVR